MSGRALCSRSLETYEVACLFQYAAAALNSKQDVLNLLNSRRRQNRPRTAPQMESGPTKLPDTPTFKGLPSLFNMKDWLQCLGYQVFDLIKKLARQVIN